MLKILYYIYVGIRSFHPVLPFNKANDLIAITPLHYNLMRPLAIETFTNWLDDIYLNPRVRASNNSSRFAESEDYSPLPDPTHRPRHSRYSSTSWSLQNGTVHRSAPGNILTISRTPTATDGSCATRGGTPTLLLRPTLAIVLKSLFVCPPPHDLLILFQDLIVSCYIFFYKFGSRVLQAITILNQIVFGS